MEKYIQERIKNGQKKIDFALTLPTPYLNTYIQNGKYIITTRKSKRII